MTESPDKKRDYVKFNGINFPQWKYAVMLKLRKKKLEAIVLGTETKPTQETLELVVDDVTSIVVTNQATIDAWMERDVDACSIIFYNIEPTYQTSIEGSTTAHEMWTRLTLQYAEVSVANASLLLGKFHQYKMDPDHSIVAHINRMRMMAEELKSVGINVSELELLVRIIQTLPPSYRYFISAWESVQPAQQTLANLTARLITEELRSKTYGTDAADTAFFASHPSRTKQQQSDANAARSNDTRNRGEYSHRKYRDSHDYRGGSFQRNDNTYRCQH